MSTAPHRLDVFATAAAQQTAAILGLSIAEDWHAHDSRPGSYCRRVGPIGHRRTVHLMHDGHAMTDDHVLVYRTTAPSWRKGQPVWPTLTDTNGATAALRAAAALFPHP